jgi:hypothetical protein
MAAHRSYTVSQRVLAANRRKLEWARQVEPGRVWRETPRRRAAWLANLEKGRALLHDTRLSPEGYPRTGVRDSGAGVREPKPEIRVANPCPSAKPESQIPHPESGNRPSTIGHRPFPDSPSYGTGLLRGLYAVSLRRSARLVGESSEAFDRHVERFLEVLAPGLAEIVWRRLRLFRSQAHWEETRLIRLLQSAASLRGPGCGPLPLGSREVRNSESEIRDSLLGLGALKSQISNLKSSGLPNPGAPLSTPGSSGLRDPFQSQIPNLKSSGLPNLSPGPGPRSPVPLWFHLGLSIERIFDLDFRMPLEAEKLDTRFERLGMLWVKERAGIGDCYLAGVMPRADDWKLLLRPPAAMGNPFLRTGTVEKVLKDPGERHALRRKSRPKRSHAPHAGGVRNSGSGFRAGGGESRGTEAGDPGLDSPEALGERWQQAIEGLRARWGISLGEAPHQPPTANSQQALIAVLWKRLTYFRDLAAREEQEVEWALAGKVEGQVDAESLARFFHWPPEASAHMPNAVMMLRLAQMFRRHTSPEAWRELQELNGELAMALRDSLAAESFPAESEPAPSRPKGGVAEGREGRATAIPTLLDSLQFGPEAAQEACEREQKLQELERDLAQLEADLARAESEEEKRLIIIGRQALQQAFAIYEG